MKVPVSTEPHGRAGLRRPTPGPTANAGGPRRWVSTTQRSFPAQAPLQEGHFSSLGNLHLVGKKLPGETDCLFGTHVTWRTPMALGAAWGAGVYGGPLLGFSHGHAQSSGKHIRPSDTTGWCEGQRATYGLASASVQRNPENGPVPVGSAGGSEVCRSVLLSSAVPWSHLRA